MSESGATPCVRRASAYLLVLGGTLLLVTAGMSAVYASGVRRASGELDVDAWKARLAAEAGIEAALDKIHTDSTWRSTMSSGNWYSGRSTGDGTFSTDVVDKIDGNFVNNPSDPVEITSTGTFGRGRSKLRVSLNSMPTPYSALGAVLYSGGLQVHSGTVVNDGLIHSNVSVTAATASISGTVAAVTTVLGVTYTGTTQPLAAARQAPTFASLSYYTSNGTVINRTSLRRTGQRYYLEEVVLSPASNPYGAANPLGIYIIDAIDDELHIQNCRIVGTLIVLRPGSGSDVDKSVNIAPAVANYPVLLVDGNIELKFDNTDPLTESGANCNFNPAGTPYAASTDGDKTDSYPSQIQGLVFIRGNLVCSKKPKVIGNIICGGTVTTGGNLELSYTTTCFSSPPPGFTLVPIPMKAIAGTWQQVVD